MASCTLGIGCRLPATDPAKESYRAREWGAEAVHYIRRGHVADARAAATFAASYARTALVLAPTWEVRQHGDLRFLAWSEAACWSFLHWAQSQSVAWATTYEGWTIQERFN